MTQEPKKKKKKIPAYKALDAYLKTIIANGVRLSEQKFLKNPDKPRETIVRYARIDANPLTKQIAVKFKTNAEYVAIRYRLHMENYKRQKNRLVSRSKDLELLRQIFNIPVSVLADMVLKKQLKNTKTGRAEFVNHIMAFIRASEKLYDITPKREVPEWKRNRLSFHPPLGAFKTAIKEINHYFEGYNIPSDKKWRPYRRTKQDPQS